MSEQPSAVSRQRDNKSGKIAAVLDLKTVVLNRGFREQVKQADWYFVENTGSVEVIFEVIRVEEKMSILTAIWISENSHKIGIGTELSLLESENG